MKTASRAEIEDFVKTWVAQNVRPVSKPAALQSEVDRLAAQLTGDARALGISGGDINRTIGDIDDYLMAQHGLVFEATAAG
jgi:hypothetical protein